MTMSDERMTLVLDGIPQCVGLRSQVGGCKIIGMRADDALDQIDKLETKIEGLEQQIKEYEETDWNF